MVVLDLSDLGPDYCETRDLPAPSSNIDQDEMGYLSIKKHPRTQEPGDNDDNMEIRKKKKAKKTISETEVDSSSSDDSDHSCFVALVTASNLHKDALCLPQDFSSSNDFKRKSQKIFLTDGGRRSWALDLRFNKSSDSFYISRGWRDFCGENGKKAGSFFMFKLVQNGETPFLSFSPADSITDGTRGDNNNKEYCMEQERKKDSTSPNQNRFMTLPLRHDSLRRGRQYLSKPFMTENGVNKPGVITLLGKDGSKWLTNLRVESGGSLCLGMGWREFAKANDLKAGESFTLELIWENGIPMLSLFSTESTSDRKQQGECPKDSEKESFFAKPKSGNKTNNNRDDSRDSSSVIDDRFVILRYTRDASRKGRLYLPFSFTTKNGLDKPGMITLLGKDSTKWVAQFRREISGRMSLGRGWKEFAKANGLKIGESFTLESLWENGTPMFSLVSRESTSDTRQQGECSGDREKEYFSTQPNSGNKTREAKNSIEERRRDSSSADQNRFVTLTLTPEDVRDCKLIVPSQFMKANGINKLGKITLLGKNRMKWFGYLLSKDGIVALGCGWKGFCEANGVMLGESFTLECIYEQDTTHAFKFCSNSRE